jgi:hypothetical protein
LFREDPAEHRQRLLAERTAIVEVKATTPMEKPVDDEGPPEIDDDDLDIELPWVGLASVIRWQPAIGPVLGPVPDRAVRLRTPRSDPARAKRDCDPALFVALRQATAAPSRADPQLGASAERSPHWEIRVRRDGRAAYPH